MWLRRYGVKGSAWKSIALVKVNEEVKKTFDLSKREKGVHQVCHRSDANLRRTVSGCTPYRRGGVLSGPVTVVTHMVTLLMNGHGAL